MKLSSEDQDHFLQAALAACRAAGPVHRDRFRTDDLTVERKDDGSPVTPCDRETEAVIREVLARATPELGLLGEEHGEEGSTTDRWIIDPLDGTKNFISGLPYFAVLVALQLGGEPALGVVHAPALDPRPQGTGESFHCGRTWWAARGRGAFAGTGTTPEAPWRPIEVSRQTDLRRAFVTHGGLRRLQDLGLWSRFSEMVARVGRTRGFGDWWGHMLVAEGRCDAMIEGAVALHDIAAVKVIVEEAGGTFTARHDAPLTTDFNAAVMTTNAHLAPELREMMDF